MNHLLVQALNFKVKKVQSKNCYDIYLKNGKLRCVLYSLWRDWGHMRPKILIIIQRTLKSNVKLRYLRSITWFIRPRSYRIFCNPLIPRINNPIATSCLFSCVDWYSCNCLLVRCWKFELILLLVLKTFEIVIGFFLEFNFLNPKIAQARI